MPINYDAGVCSFAGLGGVTVFTEDLVYARCVAKVADMPSGAPFLLQGCSELVRAHGRRGDFLEVPLCVENVSSYASFTLQR